MTDDLVSDDLVKWLRSGNVAGMNEAADRIDKLEALLEQRDLFIVKQGLWTEFVTTLEGKDD